MFVRPNNVTKSHDGATQCDKHHGKLTRGAVVGLDQPFQVEPALVGKRDRWEEKQSFLFKGKAGTSSEVHVNCHCEA